jgi:hypothetical protein
MKNTTYINIDCIPEKEFLSPEFKLDAQSNSDGIFIYESSDPSIFTVDQDGIVTITGPGKAFIIISQLETNNFYSGQIERLITVNKSLPPINFIGPNILNLAFSTINQRTLTINTVENLDKNVTSSNPEILEIIQIDNKNYELIPKFIGSATIIVRTQENYFFKSSVANFNIEISDAIQKKPILININTFNSVFEHDALKNIDILTSNIDPSTNDNNLQITIQNKTIGYEYDIPIFNTSPQSFIKNISNFSKELLCCPSDQLIEINLTWNFNNVLVYDFYPYDKNFNNRPRINILKSDNSYIEYIPAGKEFLKIPINSTPNDPNAFIYEEQYYENQGSKKFLLPSLNCINELNSGLNIFYSIEFFNHDFLIPTLQPTSGWNISNTQPGEVKYQYIFTGNYEKNIFIGLNV